MTQRECLTRLNSFLWQHGAAAGLHVSIYINLLSYLKIKGRIGVLKFCNGTPVINGPKQDLSVTQYLMMYDLRGRPVVN